MEFVGREDSDVIGPEIEIGSGRRTKCWSPYDGKEVCPSGEIEFLAQI